MQRIFGDIPYCLNQRDDILIGGRNREEHDKTLEIVLKRADDYGITFSKEKCQFGVNSIEFYGYRFTENGIMPTEEKVRAVKECGEPKTKTEVRSFLGMIGYLSKFIPKYSTLTAPLRALTHKNDKFRWGQIEKEAFHTLKEAITDQKIMAYFNPRLPIVLRTEASFHDGLSAAIFQKTRDGMRPVHYISRTMTETEKRYSQTEKDALAVVWAKKRFAMYLQGAPRFRIITAHKPLLPMFNKPTAKLPPRIEKWVMSMQDADFEMVYEPGKDEKDPLDFISRHPLPETGKDKTEAVIKTVIENEHAIVLSKIQEETKKDPTLKKLEGIINNGSWEKHRQDPQIAPFLTVKDELYIAENLIFRMNKIVVPERLRRKIIDQAHKMGHFGITRTKQMIREKYWFPMMNKMIENILAQCYECMVTRKEHRTCPIKPQVIPASEWHTVSIDFGGPYPDGHYNLVVIDKRTRYPEVEVVRSTNFKSTETALRRMFATHGIPRRVESDNGPPFNSKEFENFADELGFHHHKVTPEHAQANGAAESFMKTLNRMEQLCKLQHEDHNKVLQQTLMGYRSTPHPATNMTPYEAMMHRPVRTLMDTTERKLNDEEVETRDAEYKKQLKKNKENRNTREHNFIVGDYVLLKQAKRNKWTPAYEPHFYQIYKIEGSTIKARRVDDGKEVCRDASKFKLANSVLNMNDPDQKIQEEKMEEIDEIEDSDNWREDVLKNAPDNDTSNNDRDTVQDIPTGDEEKHSDNVPEIATNPDNELKETNAAGIPTSRKRTIINNDGLRRSERVRRKPKYYEDYVP